MSFEAGNVYGITGPFFFIEVYSIKNKNAIGNVEIKWKVLAVSFEGGNNFGTYNGQIFKLLYPCGQVKPLVSKKTFGPFKFKGHRVFSYIELIELLNYYVVSGAVSRAISWAVSRAVSSSPPVGSPSPGWAHVHSLPTSSATNPCICPNDQLYLSK